MTSKRLLVWIEGAVVAALAIVLSLIPMGIGTSFSVSLGMIPLTIYAMRRGTLPGIYAGLIWGLLHFLTGQVYFLSVIQVLIEYLLAFTFAGFAGLYHGKIAQSVKSGNQRNLMGYIVAATFVGSFARYFWHFLAGVVFWGAYAFAGMSPFVFSLVMNGASGLATAVVTSIVAVAIASKFPQIYLADEKISTVNQEK